MKKYAVELGEVLGKRLTRHAQPRGLSLTAVVRTMLWEGLDKATAQAKAEKKAKASDQ